MKPSPLVNELVYQSYLNSANQLTGLDSVNRDISITRQLFSVLNLDFHSWPRVTVTGSKGKGSTSALLANILTRSGERVGLVTSPHLHSFTERIRIDGLPVSDLELDQAAREIAPAVRKITASLTPPKYLGPTGVILALAHLIFSQHQVSALVIEAGRGGEFDESRLVAADVSVLTPILLEHPDKLGPTVTNIAATKTLITPPGHSIVSAPQSPEVHAVILKVATQLGSPLLQVGTDIRVSNPRQTGVGVTCDIQLGNIFYPQLYINLPDLHQADNAATAILAAHTLSKLGVKFTPAGVTAGLKTIHWPDPKQ